MKKQIVLLASVLALGLGFSAHAEETVTEKIETSANKAGDSIKKGYRSAKDKTCEMVNGKMECAGKKMKHKGQNMMDKAGTTGTEVKNELTK